MKLNHSLLVVTFACGTMWAQNIVPLSPPQNQPANSSKPVPPATKGAAGTPNPAAKPGTTAKSQVATPPKPAQTQSGTPTPHIVPLYSSKPTSQSTTAKTKAPAPATKVVAAPAPKPAAPTGEPKQASVKETATTTSAIALNGKPRDPFVSPVVRSNGVITSGCDTGKRCLVVDQIVLKGIVKSGTGYIALVENPARRAYFMRENDPVFHGHVTKITGDTVVFQEEVTDKLGKQSMREVVKKVNAPIV
jgi:cytoskeletal protein RodZ